MGPLALHVRGCETCRAALRVHDEGTPRCGDDACDRIAYCPDGEQFREEYKAPRRFGLGGFEA